MSTIYQDEIDSAYTDLQENGTSVLIEFDVNKNYNPTSGKTANNDQPPSLATFGILTKPSSRELATLAKDLAERVTTGATIASKPINDAGRELTTSARVTISAKEYRILGFRAVEPDGTPIIHKLLLEAT